MPATASQIHVEATTFDTYLRFDRNIKATAYHEILTPRTVRAHVQRHEARLRSLANEVAIDYAMFEADTLKNHGPDAKCAPLDRAYIFPFLRRRYGREYANDMSSDALVHCAVASLPYARRIVAEADAS
jgi:hypothetical protein